VQYVEGRTLVLDSVPIGSTTGDGTQRFVGDTVVTCVTGATQCYFYKPGSEISTAPIVMDLELNVFGLGVQGLRGYVDVRLRDAFGNENEKFWPQSDDRVQLVSAFLEYDHRLFRVRAGRDYELSALGLWGYDGGSLLFRIPTGRIELEAYGGLALARGVPERITADIFDSLGEFKARIENWLFGFRGSANPMPGTSINAIYQREIDKDRSGIATERIGLDATYSPNAKWRFAGWADYDLAANWWGKAGLEAAWSLKRNIFLEGKVWRYRPLFSLQSIWVAFSPAAYTGYGVALGLQPRRDLSFRLAGELWDYGQTDAEVPFFTTTNKSYRAGIWGRWQPKVAWDLEGGYWLNWGFGAAVSSGDLKFNWYTTPGLTLGARFSAYDRMREFRLGEDFAWSLGADARWVTRPGTLWLALDNYWHNVSEDAADSDWTQLRASLGFSYYIGSEPGRRQ
jgi:hypothetical protein